MGLSSVERRAALGSLVAGFVSPAKEAEVCSDRVKQCTELTTAAVEEGRVSEHSGMLRREALIAVPLITTGLLACGKKKPKPQRRSNRNVPKPLTNNKQELLKKLSLEADVRLLEYYLAHQKVVDLKRVHKVYLTEQVLESPERYGLSFSPQKIRDMRMKTMDAHTIFPLLFDDQQLMGGGRLVLYKKPTVVLIPRALLPWSQGTPAQQRSFDSVIYHEVEGHGVDFSVSSQFMGFVKRVLGYLATTPQGTQRLFNLLEDVHEFSAYVVEVDRLITKFQYDRNPDVVTAETTRRIEYNLGVHAMTILHIMRNKGKNAQFDRFISDLDRFVQWRIKKASPRTRTYLRNLVRKQKWPYAIPF